MSERLTEDLLELMRGSGYSERVIKYFRDKVNMGRMENADCISDYTSPCGDTLQIYLKIDNGGLPGSKLDCAKLAVTAIRRAITEYMALGPFESRPNPV